MCVISYTIRNVMLKIDLKVPVMTTIEQMPAKLLDILICKCTTSCDTKKCKCQTAGMGCTLLCHKKYNHNNCKNKYNSNSGL